MVDIIQQSCFGKSLIEYYEINKTLTKSFRNFLTTIICEFWIKESHQPDTHDYFEAATQIHSVFPNEPTVSYTVLAKNIATDFAFAYKIESIQNLMI